MRGRRRGLVRRLEGGRRPRGRRSGAAPSGEYFLSADGGIQWSSLIVPAVTLTAAGVLTGALGFAATVFLMKVLVRFLKWAF